MSERVVIFGASDDLIEIEGAVRDEFSAYDKAMVVTVMVDDATYASVHVEYDPDGSGEWRVQPTALGSLVSIIPARGEDEGDDADGCPGYSDKAIVDLGVIEPRRVNVRCAETGADS